MTRRLVCWFAVSAAAVCGCAGTWERVSSHQFRDAPFKAMFTSEDPMTVLRTKVEGGDRAAAMRRLKEPLAAGLSEPEQDEALQILSTAATSDPSPVVRTAAIDALGRFKDPRAVPILIAAYHQADGVPSDPARAAGGVQQAAAFRTADATDPLSLLGPVGFEQPFVTTLRSRSVSALANTNSPEAVAFLARVAAPGTEKSAKPDAEPTDRDVRSAAVKGLGKMRSPAAVTALARVLKDEAGHDVVLAQNAHTGLKELTGRNLPADPEQWDQLIQTGVTVQPEPNLIQRAIGWR